MVLRNMWNIAEYVDDIIDLLKAMGMNDEDCNVEEFISPLEEDQVNVIMHYIGSQMRKQLLH